VPDDAAVDQHGDGLLAHRQRQKKPFPRPKWFSKAIHDLDVQPSLGKELMQEILELVRIQLDSVICSDRVNRRE
jgi:hypothetical protein